VARDLSILIGPDHPWMATLAFLTKPDDNLKIAMK
jgi:hypothetical protein